MSSKQKLRRVYNQPFERCHKWGSVSIDKISFSIKRYYINSKFVNVHFGSISIVKAGDYYCKIHIHAEHFNQEEFLVFQINRALMELYIAGIIHVGNNTESLNIIDIIQNLKLIELEVAFDMPKRRINWAVALLIFIKEHNSFYSKDYKKRTKKSLICLYNRTLKLMPQILKKPNIEPVYRFELRFRTPELVALVPEKNRNLINCDLLYQKPIDLIYSIEKPMAVHIKRLGIPYNLFLNYKDHPLIERIMAGRDL